MQKQDWNAQRIATLLPVHGVNVVHRQPPRSIRFKRRIQITKRAHGVVTDRPGLAFSTQLTVLAAASIVAAELRDLLIVFLLA